MKRIILLSRKLHELKNNFDEKYIYFFFSINIYFYYYIIKEFHGHLKSKDKYFMFCQAPHFFCVCLCGGGGGMVGALCGPKVVKPLSPPFFYRSFLSPMAHFLL